MSCKVTPLRLVASIAIFSSSLALMRDIIEP